MAAPRFLEYLAPLLGILNIAISLPLMLGKIPPNRFYGFRTRKTLANGEIWYQANYTGAQNMIVATIVALVGMAFVTYSFNRTIAAPVNLAMVVAAMAIAGIVSLLQIRKM